MTKDEQYAYACAHLIKDVTTWEDAYTFFEEMMKGVNTFQNPAMLLDAVYTMYSFILAMKELPEEGDIQVLFRKMMHVLVVEGQEKLGASVEILTPEEAYVRQRVDTAAAISAMIDTDKPRTVH